MNTLPVRPPQSPPVLSCSLSPVFAVLRLFAWAALAAGALPFAVPGVHAAERRPNVVIIFTDDQGSVDLGCYGAADLETPAVDALAARGLRFTRFYAAAPVCSPSRAGLLTGRHPVRAGMPGNAPSQPGGKGMPADQVTIADTFKAAGYRTALIGKWHLGYTPETSPLAQGFDEFFGHMGGCIDNYSHFFYWQGPNRHDLHRNDQPVHLPGRFFPDLMVEESVRFMEECGDQPFLLYFASNAPHYPYQGDPEWLERYAATPYPRNLYKAFLSTLDARIGRLIGHLDRLGLRENTIVVFQSDHGHSVEERAHGGGGSSGPFRGHKFTMYEGGLRVPAIISWPGRLPEGGVRDQAAHSCDWLPTLAALAGVPLLSADLDGRSLVPLLSDDGASSPHHTLHWQTGGGEHALWAVLSEGWKLVGRGGADQRRNLELFHLDTDQGETTSRVADEPAQLARLLGLRQAWETANTP